MFVYLSKLLPLFIYPLGLDMHPAHHCPGVGKT